MRASDEAFQEMLSRYLDGELSEAETLEVEAFLAEDPAAQAQLESQLRLQSALRTAYRAEADAVDFGRLWQGIEAGLDRVDAQKAHLEAAQRAQQPGLLERISTWFQGLSRAPLGLGLAAAAVLVALGLYQLLTYQLLPYQLLPVGSQSGQGEVADAGANSRGTGLVQAPPETGSEGAPKHPEPEETVVAALDPVVTEGVEVTDVEGGSEATVMVIHSPDNATIIWVHENGAEGGSSI